MINIHCNVTHEIQAAMVKNIYFIRLIVNGITVKNPAIFLLLIS